ncbi:MAG: hypothetical protein M3Q05_01795 [Bacteroidota bacterium]|nr:hypothetical protein [Bacteroidota bacterium]
MASRPLLAVSNGLANLGSLRCAVLLLIEELSGLHQQGKTGKKQTS